jgi:hypothetical protein
LVAQITEDVKRRKTYVQLVDSADRSIVSRWAQTEVGADRSLISVTETEAPLAITIA